MSVQLVEYVSTYILLSYHDIYLPDNKDSAYLPTILHISFWRRAIEVWSKLNCLILVGESS